MDDVLKSRLFSNLKVPVGGGPGGHQLGAGGGEEAVNVAPQLTWLEPEDNSKRKDHRILIELDKKPTGRLQRETQLRSGTEQRPETRRRHLPSNMSFIILIWWLSMNTKCCLYILPRSLSIHSEIGLLSQYSYITSNHTTKLSQNVSSLNVYDAKCKCHYMSNLLNVLSQNKKCHKTFNRKRYNHYTILCSKTYNHQRYNN